MSAVDAVTAPGRLRILVVDDNIDQVRSMAYLLRDLGYQVDYALNGIIAADVALRTRPHIVLLDMHLGDTSGMQVARELRRNGKLLGTCIVGITGYPVSRSDALGAGFDDVLTKPVDLRELQALLARAA